MKTILKAITGGVVAGAGALTTAATDSTISTSEWITVAAAFIVGFGGVWLVPNKAAIKP
jgi:hypothetical protein